MLELYYISIGYENQKKPKSWRRYGGDWFAWIERPICIHHDHLCCRILTCGILNYITRSISLNLLFKEAVEDRILSDTLPTRLTRVLQHATSPTKDYLVI